MGNSIEIALLNCKKDLKKKYAGNENYVLKHSDYQNLAEEIFKVSKVSLSLSTLSRFFRENYNRTPNITTLNAFAIYLGNNNWKEYYKNNFSPSTYNGKRIFLRIIAISSPILLLTGIYIFYKKLPPHSSHDLSKVEFYHYAYDSTKVPSTITYHYNLKGSGIDSAVFHPLGYLEKGRDDICILRPHDSTITFNYLYAGCYYPKLVVDGKVIKETRVNFVTNRWTANIVKYNPFYMKYFDDPEIFKNREMAFSKSIFKKANFPASDFHEIWFQLFKDFGNIDGDSLYFETRIKNELPADKAESGKIIVFLFFRFANITMIFENETSSLSEIGLNAIDKFHSSKKENLSFLYQDFTKWNKIKCKTYEKKFELYMNDSLKFQSDFNTQVGKLYGIRYIFTSLGKVDYVKFYNSQREIIYNNEFE